MFSGHQRLIGRQQHHTFETKFFRAPHSSLNRRAHTMLPEQIVHDLDGQSREGCFDVCRAGPHHGDHGLKRCQRDLGAMPDQRFAT
jgi:hypothetical protein